MKEIPLTKGHVALVDDEDFECLSQWKWQIDAKGYPRRMARINGKKVNLYLARQIMNPAQGLVVDHQNHDPLDNRRSNLRIATVSQNVQNSRRRKKSRSAKGVYWVTAEGKWRARIMANGVRTNLGNFDSHDQAATAYKNAAFSLHGAFAFCD
jgi:hypothetical protein